MSPHPRSPASVDWAGKARAWGIDLEAPVELEPVTGPALGSCDVFSDGKACSGTYRIVAQDGPIWVVVCDVCRSEMGLPARLADPDIRRQARLAHAGLPERFVDQRFERVPDSAPVLEQLRRWIGSYDDAVGAASLLPAPCLWGLQGRGKTLLLTKVCQQVIRECDLPVAFMTVRGLLRDLQRFDDDVVRGQAWQRASTIAVLALDDLGAEQSTDWKLDQLADLVDSRYAEQLPILVATNYPPAQWDQVLDARTVSRLRQMTFPLELQGADRRLQPLEAA